jgi:hypothetical protein
MKGRLTNGNPPAADQARHTTHRSAEDAVSEQGGAQTPFIKVKCPNPACGTLHNAKTTLAGKKGRCPDCGALISIPNMTASAPNRPCEKSVSPAAAVDATMQSRGELTRRKGAELREVRAACIGRGGAGKTALFRALDESLVGDFFPSGLHVDVGDPREVAQMIREAEKTQRILQSSGLPPTLQASQIRYYLYDGEEQLVVYKMREVIGQVLTHTLPDSPAAQQADYGEYLKSLVNTHVLWAMVPCPPPNPGARERRRYANDLRITIAYLREALRLRSLKQPAAVVLVLSKIDTLFKDAEEAQATLTDDVLRKALGPLVHLIDKSARVSDAAIIPVTAFGFGNAILREPGDEQDGAPPESADEPFGAEPIWLLREGVAPDPFNLDTLFLWTLLFGLLNQEGHGFEAESEIGEICRMLRENLDAGDPWLLSLKGGIRGEGKRVSRIRSTEQA